MPPHIQQNANRSLPRRVDSLITTKGQFFAEVQDELRDIRRVNAQGQEEDLKYALTRMINRVEELTSMLKEAFKAQTDLQTELTLAKSNLQLALANNEMLEDALKRDGAGHVRDIGWRRWSAREQKEREEADRRRSADSRHSAEMSSSSPVMQQSPVPEHSPVPRSATIPSTAPTEGRFFKFRFGNGSAIVSSPSSPRISGSQSPSVNGNVYSAHLTSASLPSLVSSKDRDKAFEELNAQLELERKAHKTASAEKEALEAELESLSQALFEEANRMVAAERMKRAETEEALREAQEQREALRNVLHLVERDSGSANRRPYGYASKWFWTITYTSPVVFVCDCDQVAPILSTIFTPLPVGLSASTRVPPSITTSGSDSTLLSTSPHPIQSSDTVKDIGTPHVRPPDPEENKSLSPLGILTPSPSESPESGTFFLAHRALWTTLTARSRHGRT
ncbi:hypothetical protein A0H81_09314 [Grifola frondosa]|uniref:GDP/GTP exchange factor Sec2 N-terminal domain-containing protein n=1 Tax=Grifola frondosa TaxID=5627 RepID=A0A1C7M2W3_GRIFR|nr:hypothetical protein A0H81_09314 [Grifola frondosa]